MVYRRKRDFAPLGWKLGHGWMERWIQLPERNKLHVRVRAHNEYMILRWRK